MGVLEIFSCAREGGGLVAGIPIYGKDGNGLQDAAHRTDGSKDELALLRRLNNRFATAKCAEDTTRTGSGTT